MRSLFRVVAIVFISCVLPACSTGVRVYKGGDEHGSCKTIQNDILLNEAENQVYSVPSWDKTNYFSQKKIAPPFISIASSGGGDRAAVYAMSILEGLNGVPVADSNFNSNEFIGFLSTVSGSSLAGAYYALNYNKSLSGFYDLVDNDKQKYKLSHILPWRWGNVVLAWGAGKRALKVDQEDILSNFDNMFDQQSVYEIVDSNGPKALINSYGASFNKQFVFLPRNFEYYGYNMTSFMRYPTSAAVLSSAAYPVILDDVVFEIKKDEVKHIDLINPNGEYYTHFRDGGMFDNSGLTTLSHAYDQSLYDREAASDNLFKFSNFDKKTHILVFIDAGGSLDATGNDENYLREESDSPFILNRVLSSVDNLIDRSSSLAKEKMLSQKLSRRQIRHEALVENVLNINKALNSTSDSILRFKVGKFKIAEKQTSDIILDYHKRRKSMISKVELCSNTLNLIFKMDNNPVFRNETLNKLRKDLDTEIENRSFIVQEIQIEENRLKSLGNVSNNARLEALQQEVISSDKKIAIKKEEVVRAQRPKDFIDWAKSKLHEAQAKLDQMCAPKLTNDNYFQTHAGVLYMDEILEILDNMSNIASRLQYKTAHSFRDIDYRYADRTSFNVEGLSTERMQLIKRCPYVGTFFNKYYNGSKKWLNDNLVYFLNDLIENGQRRKILSNFYMSSQNSNKTLRLLFHQSEMPTVNQEKRMTRLAFDLLFGKKFISTNAKDSNNSVVATYKFLESEANRVNEGIYYGRNTTAILDKKFMSYGLPDKQIPITNNIYYCYYRDNVSNELVRLCGLLGKLNATQGKTSYSRNNLIRNETNDTFAGLYTNITDGEERVNIDQPIIDEIKERLDQFAKNYIPFVKSMNSQATASKNEFTFFQIGFEDLPAEENGDFIGETCQKIPTKFFIDPEEINNLKMCGALSVDLLRPALEGLYQTVYFPKQ